MSDMSYNEEKLAKAKAVKQLAQRINAESNRIPEPVESITNSELEEILK